MDTEDRNFNNETEKDLHLIKNKLKEIDFNLECDNESIMYGMDREFNYIQEEVNYMNKLLSNINEQIDSTNKLLILIWVLIGIGIINLVLIGTLFI